MNTTDGRERGRSNAKRVVIGVALVALGAGCAGAGGAKARSEGAKSSLLFAPSREVHVLLGDAGCPVDIDPGALDPETTCNKPRCFKAPAKKNQQVIFKAWSLSANKPITDKDFELQFDPFKSKPLKSTGGTLTVTVDVDMPGKPGGFLKEFVYNVLVAGCTPLDPQIIVVN